MFFFSPCNLLFFHLLMWLPIVLIFFCILIISSLRGTFFLIYIYEGHLNCLSIFVRINTGINILAHTVSTFVSFAVEYFEVEIAVNRYADLKIIWVFPECHCKKLFPVFKKHAPKYKLHEGKST